MNRWLIPFAFLLLFFSSQAQDAEGNLVYLETDKDIYTAGSFLWFSVSHWNKNGLDNHKSPDHVLFALVNEKKQVLDLHYFESAQSIAQNAFYLSPKLDPGRYFVVVFSPDILGKSSYKPVYKSIEVRKKLLAGTLVETHWTETEEGSALHTQLSNRLDGEGVKASLVLEASSNQNLWDTLAIGRSDRAGKRSFDLTVQQLTSYKHFRLQVKSSKDTLVHWARKTRTGDFEIAFLPSGGRLVKGVQNRLHLKVNRSNGAGIRLSGRLKSGGREWAFQTDANGKATIEFVPEKKADCRVELATKDETFTQELPSALFAKLGFQVERLDKDSIYIRFKNNGIREKARLRQLNKEGNNIQSRFWKLNLPQGDTTVALANTSFGKTSHWVLESENGGLSLGEQEIVSNAQPLRLEAELYKAPDYFGGRDAVNIKLNITDTEGRFVPDAVVGIKAVSMLNKQQNSPASLSHFLRLKRHITPHHLGFRLPGFYELFENSLVPESPEWPELPLSTLIEGLVYKKGDKGLAAAGPTSYLLISEQGVYTQFTRSNGSFFLPVQELMGRTGEQLIIKPGCEDCQLQLNNTKAHLKRKINHYLADKSFVIPVLNEDATFDSRVQEQIQLSGMNFLEEVVVVKRRKEQRGERLSAFGYFRGATDDYVCSQYGVLNCINHQTGGVPPEEGKYYRTNTGGRVLYRVKRPETKVLDPFKINPFAVVEGFYPSQSFDSPDYSMSKESGVADQRQTLVWYPALSVKENEILTFFTGDDPGIYQIELVAFTVDGKSAEAQLELRVY
jgi:hypothetical protein